MSDTANTTYAPVAPPPQRNQYRHTCGAVSVMNQQLADTFSVQPNMFEVAYCQACDGQFASEDFVWVDGGKVVGAA